MGIHLAVVSVFAGMTGKNRHFRDLSQQVLSGVVDLHQFAQRFLKLRRSHLKLRGTLHLKPPINLDT